MGPQEHRRHRQGGPDKGLDKAQGGIEQRAHFLVEGGKDHDHRHNDGRQTGVISEAQDLAEQDYHPNHCRHPEGIEGQETEINGAGDSTDEGSQARDAEAQVSRRVACRTTTPEISDQSPPTAAQAPRNR